MDFGQTTTIWTARLSAAIYGVAVLLIVRKAETGARILWTVGLTTYLVHVWFAFNYFYNWSHAVAYRETARQTAALFGVDWGGGLYLNYLFTAIWLADCVWWWIGRESYHSRPAWVALGMHTFMAFMFLNATIVGWILMSLTPTS